MDKNISVLMQQIKAKTGQPQHKLAEMLSTTQPTIGRILNGQRNCEIDLYERILDLHMKVRA